MRIAFDIVAGVAIGIAFAITILTASSIGGCVSISDSIRAGHLLMSSECAE